MPHIPALKARFPEWNTVIAAMRFYSQHLEESRASLDKDSDEYLLIYDDLERLDALIPDFEQQLKQLTEEAVNNSVLVSMKP